MDGVGSGEAERWAGAELGRTQPLGSCGRRHENGSSGSGRRRGGARPSLSLAEGFPALCLGKLTRTVLLCSFFPPLSLFLNSFLFSAQDNRLPD